MELNNKRILNKIAKEWAKKILLGTELAEEEGETGLTAQEEAYLCERVRAIGEKISKEEPAFTLRAIVEKYYEFE